MGLGQGQLGRVLQRDDALSIGDEGGQSVQERGLTRAGAPDDEQVAMMLDRELQEARAARGQGAAARQFSEVRPARRPALPPVPNSGLKLKRLAVAR